MCPPEMVTHLSDPAHPFGEEHSCKHQQQQIDRQPQQRSRRAGKVGAAFGIAQFAQRPDTGAAVAGIDRVDDFMRASFIAETEYRCKIMGIILEVRAMPGNSPRHPPRRPRQAQPVMPGDGPETEQAKRNSGPDEVIFHTRDFSPAQLTINTIRRAGRRDSAAPCRWRACRRQLTGSSHREECGSARANRAHSDPGCRRCVRSW